MNRIDVTGDEIPNGVILLRIALGALITAICSIERVALGLRRNHPIRAGPV